SMASSCLERHFLGYGFKSEKLMRSPAPRSASFRRRGLFQPPELAGIPPAHEEGRQRQQEANPRHDILERDPCATICEGGRRGGIQLGGSRRGLPQCRYRDDQFLAMS